MWPEPDPAPVTTIAWRLAHVAASNMGTRANAFFGGMDVPDAATFNDPRFTPPIPSSAAVPSCHPARPVLFDPTTCSTVHPASRVGNVPHTAPLRRTPHRGGRLPNSPRGRRSRELGWYGAWSRSRHSRVTTFVNQPGRFSTSASAPCRRSHDGWSTSCPSGGSPRTPLAMRSGRLRRPRTVRSRPSPSARPRPPTGRRVLRRTRSLGSAGSTATARTRTAGSGSAYKEPIGVSRARPGRPHPVGFRPPQWTLSGRRGTQRKGSLGWAVPGRRWPVEPCGPEGPRVHSMGGPCAPTNPLVDGRGHCRLLEAVEESEGVVPVNVSTWVLLSGVTVGR